MTNVKVPFGDNPSDTAVLLLAKAEEAGLEPGVVRTIAGHFVVPEEIADIESSVTEPVAEKKAEPKKAPAKKTAAKKTAAKKTTAKKTAAKKAAAPKAEDKPAEQKSEATPAPDSENKE